MKRLACLVLSAVALTAASNDPKMEKDVLAAMESFRQAMIHNDAGGLSTVMKLEESSEPKNHAFQLSVPLST